MRKMTIGALAATTLLATAAIAQAGGWENFKLRYFSLTQIFHDQSRELGDLRQQNVVPEDNSRIDLDQLLNGGPPKDGIPSIDDPQFDAAEATPFQAEETVIGVVINGEAKAYPFNVMNWHEIVNDSVGGVPITVSYCPLCDTIVAFERGETTFGVSGKLYQSCLVMYDRADDTLYAQPWATGVVGPKVNQILDRVPAVKTSLGEWLAQYPDSQILSTRTGYSRDYQGYPYGTYYTNDQILFPVRNQEQRERHPKAIVSYVWEANDQTPHNQFSGDSHSFAHEALAQIGSQEVQLAGQTILARWDPALSTVVVEAADGTVVPSTTAFAFVYPAFFTGDEGLGRADEP
ncbi:DUF3179 domain-containing protein [Romeria aff. gracilis LEGE 07310]|uniref:DUF3179 domain-containing protein n=2 Tax=Vasconcelosia TaxID=3366328 RepID=A0A8J7DQ09_9CYAN|nr:DUF3179 domain-containing protein [Romeria aff. gracilis LEGE 07310]